MVDDSAPLVADPWASIVLACWAEGQRRSAVGPGDPRAHLEHARALARHLRPGEVRGLDLGTGAGVPGLALAGFRPDMHWTLLDAARRRTEVVRHAVDVLGWHDRVAVVHGRAEDPGVVPSAGAIDVVVARLFGPPAATAECAAPLLRRGGRLLVTEPPDAPPEERWPGEGLAVLGLERGERYADPNVQELVAVAAPEARFPRKSGVAWKRPLW